MAHVGCYCRMHRIAREDERLDYPKEEVVTAPVEKTIEEKLEDIGYTVIHIEEAVRDLFQRQGVEFTEADVEDVKQKVVEYAKGLSMTNKSTARDQLWRNIQKEVWAITKQRKGGASLFGFIRIARQVEKELRRTLICQ
jgi:signal recognition particle subunit SEC65